MRSSGLVQCRQLSSLPLDPHSVLPPSGSSFHAVPPCLALGKRHLAMLRFLLTELGHGFCPLQSPRMGVKTHSINVTERLQLPPRPTPLTCNLQLAKCQQKLLLLPRRWITLAVKIISGVLLRCLMGLLFKHG